MKSFKFFKENKQSVHTGNIYEEMIIQIYKYCNQEHYPFIGYQHTFTRSQLETITIIDIRYNSTDGIFYIDYDISTSDSSYRHVFRITNYDFERAIER